MNVTTHVSARSFLDTAGAWLARREVVNVLMLGLAHRLAAAEKPPELAPVMMTVSAWGELAAAVLMTPPRGVILYAPGDEPAAAIGALIDALIDGDYPVPECNGPNDASSLFARMWSDRTGDEAVLKTALRIYELRKVKPPSGVPGAGRVGLAADLGVLAAWAHAFALEVGEPGDLESARESTEEIIAAGNALIWEDHGRPVSAASAVRPMGRGVTISRVYTPPEDRGHGYASGCVAQLSQRQLDAGRHYCCLYADLDNPTSNGIYRKIGYAAVVDALQFRFRPAADVATADSPTRCG